MQSRLALFFSRLHQRLWVKPLGFCLLAIAAVFLARGADLLGPIDQLPRIDPDTIETLLSIISSTMLAVATFAVGSMVAAYASASNNATPRAFELILADDLSQTALSSFIGAFIFSIVATIAVKTGLYGDTGHFAIFLVTLAVFAWVIATFMRWVDNIARLGRMPSTINRAEEAARKCLAEYRDKPRLGARDIADAPDGPSQELFAEKIGYVQMVAVKDLQEAAEKAGVQIVVAAMPGAFLTPEKPLARIIGQPDDMSDDLKKRLRRAFVIGNERTFEADPRFGLIVLSEIAQRALSPGVNDPGTAIAIVGRLVRLFAFWLSPREGEAHFDPCDRVFMPGLDLADLFDDAFTGIARDGAATIELGIRLQKGFQAIAAMGNAAARNEAQRHADLALSRAEAAITLDADLDRLRAAARKVAQAGT